MEAAGGTNESVGFTPWIQLFRKLKDKATKMGKKLEKIGKDDPRRILHSFKVGLALSVISIFYYLNPIFSSLGSSSTMWAVLTVVVVMEYTAGIHSTDNNAGAVHRTWCLLVVTKLSSQSCSSFLSRRHAEQRPQPDIRNAARRSAGPRGTTPGSAV